MFKLEVGDRVTHKIYGTAGVLKQRRKDSQFGVAWDVLLSRMDRNESIGIWHENNCIPESPMEMLGRVLEESE